ncbi:ExeA family protein [Oceanicoccus sp. KOV_DT_Chl]|uniref:ExeA family protein n=1 Tax=Oceanicoccus sp. KOV_DT_Chl TaxID=1904639 RepID=UPI000C7E0178|nr:AAA family ATPase [Oceanicoccus sp. KOV_DT_Chl]
MYKKHFGLKDKPFNLIPDPDYLYLSAKHRTALSLLEYGLLETAAGLSVISGEVGSGKTTLIRKLMRRIDHGQLTVGLINNTSLFQNDLMSWVASTFGLQHEGMDKIQVFREFQKFLIAEYAQGKRTVLIVDEAQNLGGSALEELRMLTNINADRDQLLQIIIVGQPELLEVLQRQEYAQIAQRVSVEYHLGPLDLEEIHGYIRHRLQVAGASGDIFEDDAINAIYFFTGGVPRLVNTHCDYALVHGYATGKLIIDMDVIIEVMKGRKIGGINRFVKDEAQAEAVRESILVSKGVDLATVLST